MIQSELGSNLIIALPDLILAVGSIIVLIVGLFSPANYSFNLTVSGSLVTLILVLFVLVKPGILATHSQVAFNGLFINNSFTIFCKSIVTIAAIIVIITVTPHYYSEEMKNFEIPVLFLFSILGMFLLVSSHDLISLFMSLELQSLCFYILISIKKTSLRASEAGLKYFFLGSLSTTLYLYGASLVYGFSGTTEFDKISSFLFLENSLLRPSLGIEIGLSLILVSLAFKASLAPFHMWTPDVYEGGPKPTIVLMATAPKIAIFGLASQFLYQTFSSLISVWMPIITVFSILSITVGTLMAIFQTSLMRLMAYSTIAHMGFAAFGLINQEKGSLESMFLYLIIYSIMVIGVFACLLNIKKDGNQIENIRDLSGLFNNHPVISISLAILMFSLIGIPPFAGFFAKVSILKAIINAGYSELALLGVIMSVIASAYYLRIVKVIFFEKQKKSESYESDKDVALLSSLVMLLSALFLVIYTISPSILENLITSSM